MERVIKDRASGTIKFLLDMHIKTIIQNNDKNINNVIHIIVIQ
jgi:hypothetical protein